MTPNEKAAPTTKPHSQIKPAKHSTENEIAQLLGAILIKPSLAAWLPSIIQKQLSPYGLFLVKACGNGWGIEAIQRGLDDFGLDGGSIVKDCIRAVRSNPENVFFTASRQLCGEVRP